MWLQILIGFLILLAIMEIIGFRLIVPYLGKTRLPSKIPEDLAKTIKKLKRKTKLETAKAVYKFLTTKYHGGRHSTLYRWDLIWMKDLGKLWSKSGYMACNQLSWLYYLMLRKAGFSEKEARLRLTWLNLNVHEYVELNINGKRYEVDVWAATFGWKFGTRPKIFG